MDKLIRWPGLVVFFAAALFSLYLPEVLAQDTGAQDARAQDTGIPLGHAIEVYDRFIEEQAGLYNGRGYVPYIHRIEGHPYVVSGDWKRGEIFYDGRRYEHTLLKYDIFRDQVLIKAYDSPIPIVLHSERITYFRFPGYHFDRVGMDSSMRMDTRSGKDHRSDLPAGFYLTTYDGKTKVLLRMTKGIRERITESAVKREFISSNYFYIMKDGKSYPADSKGAILKILADQKGALKKMLRQQKIRFRDNPGMAIKRMAEFYDQTGSL